MLRYRLRMLLLLLAVLPPLLAVGWWVTQDRETAVAVFLFIAIPGALVSSLVAAAVFLDRGST